MLILLVTVVILCALEYWSSYISMRLHKECSSWAFFLELRSHFMKHDWVVGSYKLHLFRYMYLNNLWILWGMLNMLFIVNRMARHDASLAKRLVFVSVVMMRLRKPENSIIISICTGSVQHNRIGGFVDAVFCRALFPNLFLAVLLYDSTVKVIPPSSN